MPLSKLVAAHRDACMLGQIGLRSVYTGLLSVFQAPPFRVVDIHITRKHRGGIPKRSVGASVLHPALLWQLAAVSGVSWLELASATPCMLKLQA